MKRKLYLLVALVLAISLLIGCTPATEEPTPSKVTEPVATSRTDLNMALWGVVSTLDPFATALTIDLELFHQIYDALVYVDDYSEVHSRVAEDYTVSDDGLVYTFVINKNAYFHNGDKITAEDVVFSFNKARESGVMSPYVGIIDEVEKVDDGIVAITIKQAYTPFINNTANIFIISEKAYTEAGEGFGSSVTGAGSGPYKLVSYDGNIKIELEVFDKYYRGEASIKDVTYTVMSDQSSGLIAFESGELDFCFVPTANWNEVDSNDKYVSKLNPTSHISYMLLNPNSDLLKNQDLRYAINYAIDRDAINLLAYEGLADPAYHIMRPEYIFGASENTFRFSYDPVNAREYLNKAGYPTGVDIGKIQYTTATYFPKIAQTIQSQLAEVGINCEIVGGQTSDLVVGWRAGEFNALISGFNAALDYDYYTRYTSPAVSTSFLKLAEPDFKANWVLDMYNKGAAEQDPAKRIEIYTELENYIAGIACYVPIFYKSLPYAWDQNLDVVLDLNWYYIFDWNWK